MRTILTRPHRATLITLVALLLTMPALSRAETATLNITGRLLLTPCTLDQQDYSMTIPEVNISEFSGPGSEANVKGSTIVTISCESTSTVDITVKGAGVTGAKEDVVQINEPERHIGVRLTRDNDTAVALNKPFSFNITGGTPHVMLLEGRYQQLPGGGVTAGGVTASVTIDVVTH
ncbi:fimbrial protein [Serratia fonticola]|uniref:fimbrial protein n=1 Tax=Serratia fonticola TaxID=47917 RepID=UPI001ECAC260|nr:fimbrial protein [Serratia fonticola]MBP1036788.1 type 1 fimbrial protein [Serratia fonticola]